MDSAQTVALDDDFDELDDLIAELAEDSEHRAAALDAQQLFRLLATLRAIRKAQGLKQRDVARRMGTTQSAVSKIEGGANDPQVTTLMRYARAINARVSLVPHLDRPRAQDTAEQWVRRVQPAPERVSGIRPMRDGRRRYLHAVDAA